MAFRSLVSFCGGAAGLALLHLTSLDLAPALAASKPHVTTANVKTWCAKPDTKNVIKVILSDVIPDTAVRMTFVKLLGQGQGGECTAALATYFNELSQQKNLQEAKDRDGFKALLVVALSAQMPGAIHFVEREILAGASDEWLPTLEQTNHEAYAQTLKKWASLQATTARAQGDVSQQKQADPLIADRYFRLLNSEKTVEERDFKNTNILYTSAGIYSDTYTAILVALLRKHDAKWLPTVRDEPAWVQMRVLPLMVKVGGPEVMRELMWMSDASRDNRIRALANRSIDEMVK